MRFRRVYWVTEKLGDSGSSNVSGVCTSVHDLIEYGIPKHNGVFRLNLCELDSSGDCLLTFKSDDGSSLSDTLKPFLDSGELSLEEVIRLSEALKKQ